MTLYLIGTKQMRIRVVDSVENFILLNIKTAKTDIENMFQSVTKSTYKERRRFDAGFRAVAMCFLITCLVYHGFRIQLGERLEMTIFG